MPGLKGRWSARSRVAGTTSGPPSRCGRQDRRTAHNEADNTNPGTGQYAQRYAPPVRNGKTGARQERKNAQAQTQRPYQLRPFSHRTHNHNEKHNERHSRENRGFEETADSYSRWRLRVCILI
jgi:hypothetical protein